MSTPTTVEPFEPVMDRVVVAKRFPALVTLPSGEVLRTAMAVLTRRAVYIYAARNGAGTLVHVQPHADGQRNVGTRSGHHGPWTFTADGVTLYVTTQGGCGCGHPLKRFQPWSPWRTGPLLG